MSLEIHRGRLFHFPHDTHSPSEQYQYFDDGILVIKEGKIIDLGDAKDYLQAHPQSADQITHHQGLLVPGFIDAHAHYPQIEMIASFGQQLLDWLHDYTFPTEMKFIQREYAKEQAGLFLEQLFAHGTTTAAVFATVFPQSVDMFFEAAQAYDARMICGKVLMDRFCPDGLRDNPEQGYLDSIDLIERWHNKGRSLYAITPRFAPTSTPQQLKKAAHLAHKYPDVFIQTHLSENIKEVALVQQLFPHNKDYLDVYESAGLLRERAIFAHGVHLTDSEMQRLSTSGATLACCASSNLFLGSGLFPFDKIKQSGTHIAFGSDVGAGTSMSLLANLADAYKVCQLQHCSLDPFEAIYHCTQGSAIALKLQDKIGNLNVGTEADFIELNPRAFPMLEQRVKGAKSLQDELFALIILGDERVIEQTYVSGVKVFDRNKHQLFHPAFSATNPS
ncbi:guanine deaminase [Vibrio tritonius]|uniref:guanine deaminase n=1 Tax=Vibrio tritonius TaxID=1435069 RepID=UPI00315D8001